MQHWDKNTSQSLRNTGPCPAWLLSNSFHSIIIKHVIGANDPVIEAFYVVLNWFEMSVYFIQFGSVKFNYSLLPAATKLWPRLCFYTCVWFCSQGGSPGRENPPGGRHPPGPGRPPGSRPPPPDQAGRPHPGQGEPPPGRENPPQTFALRLLGSWCLWFTLNYGQRVWSRESHHHLTIQCNRVLAHLHVPHIALPLQCIQKPYFSSSK